MPASDSDDFVSAPSEEFSYDDYTDDDEQLDDFEEDSDGVSSFTQYDDLDGSGAVDTPKLYLKTVDSKPLTPEELLQDLHLEVSKLSSILSIDMDEGFILSHYFNWNGEKLMEQYIDNFEETRVKSGLSLESEVTRAIGIINTEEPDLCLICCEERSTWFTIACGHTYCINCYIHYIKEKVFSGSRLIKCPEPSCPLNLRPTRDILLISNYMVKNKITADVDAVVETRKKLERLLLLLKEIEEYEEDEEDEDQTDPEEDESLTVARKMVLLAAKAVAKDKTLFERYEDCSIKTYVETHSNYKWCPSPDCGGIASLQNVSKNYLKEMSLKHKNDLIPIVSCPSGHSFCFICNYENHTPASCWITKLWIQKCKDDSETANWINANTKTCPKCESNIEKNGGCNHMTCKKCRYEFCWICLGSWSKHGSSFYNCSLYNNKETVEVRTKQEKSRSSLKRYLHYYNHFTAQEQSMKGDLLFCSDIENKLMRIQEDLKDDVSWIELQFYKDSVNTLLRCRRTLKWSYALVYYLNSSNYTTILTDNQLHLSNNVERLSKLFEIFQPEEIMSKKREFNTVSDYLLKREKLLVECAIEGIVTGKLKYNADEVGKYLP